MRKFWYSIRYWRNGWKLGSSLDKGIGALRDNESSHLIHIVDSDARPARKGATLCDSSEGTDESRHEIPGSHCRSLSTVLHMIKPNARISRVQLSHMGMPGALYGPLRYGRCRNCLTSWMRYGPLRYGL